MRMLAVVAVIGLALPLQAAQYQDGYYNQRVNGYYTDNGNYVQPYYRHHQNQPNKYQNYYQSQPVQFQPMQMPMPTLNQVQYQQGFQPIQPKQYWELNQ